MSAARPVPNVLSIAGSDPSGGAGLQADIKTIAALGCYAMAVPTALTVQTTRAVLGIHLVPASFVAAQIEALFADVTIDAVKIGMLGSPEIALAVATALQPWRHLPIVLDPVLVATSGATLGDAATIAVMRDVLFPLARVITPNAAEAAVLSGVGPVTSQAEMEHAGSALRAGGTAAWLIKGGHVAADDGGTVAADLLLEAGGQRWFTSPRIATGPTHGTGCTLSSAIAAYLGGGAPLADAVAQAKTYVTGALAGARRLAVGAGAAPLDHAWQGRA